MNSVVPNYVFTNDRRKLQLGEEAKSIMMRFSTLRKYVEAIQALEFKKLTAYMDKKVQVLKRKL